MGEHDTGHLWVYHLARALDEMGEAYREARRPLFDTFPPGTSVVRHRYRASDTEPEGEESA